MNLSLLVLGLLLFLGFLLLVFASSSRRCFDRSDRVGEGEGAE